MKSSKSSWDEVFMNFIIKLSKSKNSTNEKTYNAILVIINHLIKYCHIIFFKKIYDVEQLKYIVLNRLIRYQKISKKFINDKNKLFTFNYWKTLLLILEIKLKISTTFYSQTNKQTNQKNESKFETIFKALYQQHLIKLNEIVIYDAINFECQSLKHHKSNIFLREFRKRIKPF